MTGFSSSTNYRGILAMKVFCRYCRSYSPVRQRMYCRCGQLSYIRCFQSAWKNQNFFQIGCFMCGSTYINFVVFKHLLHITPALVVADVFHSRFVFRFHPAYGIRPSQRSSRVWFHAVKWLRWHRSIVDTVRSHR